jgi:3-deoxy-D-manno-octulosonate 8-phosphate phosphatase (KDO 8-P phosphatase)
MNIKDGYAVQHCIKMNYPVAIVSGGNSEAVRERFRRLGVTDIYLSSSSKLEDYEDFRIKYGFEHEHILYMGDDIPDYQIMQKAGIPACPKDAVPEIQKIAKYISGKGGGLGCVRDVIEQVLRVQDKWWVDESFQW